MRTTIFKTDITKQDLDDVKTNILAEPYFTGDIVGQSAYLSGVFNLKSVITGGPEIVISSGDTVGNMIISSGSTTFGMNLSSTFATLGLGGSNTFPFVLSTIGGICLQLNADCSMSCTKDLAINTSATATNGNFSLIGLNNRVKTLESAGSGVS